MCDSKVLCDVYSNEWNYKDTFSQHLYQETSEHPTYIP